MHTVKLSERDAQRAKQLQRSSGIRGVTSTPRSHRDQRKATMTKRSREDASRTQAPNSRRAGQLTLKRAVDRAARSEIPGREHVETRGDPHGDHVLDAGGQRHRSVDEIALYARRELSSERHSARRKQAAKAAPQRNAAEQAKAARGRTKDSRTEATVRFWPGMSGKLFTNVEESGYGVPSGSHRRPK